MTLSDLKRSCQMNIELIDALTVFNGEIYLAKTAIEASDAANKLEKERERIEGAYKE